MQPLLALVIGFSLTTITIHQAYAEAELTADYTACIEKSDGSDPSLFACNEAEFARQDKRLTTSYQALLKQLTPERQDQLKKSQRLWLSYSEENCRFFTPPNSGTLERLQESNCQISARIARTQELDDFLNIASEKSH